MNLKSYHTFWALIILIVTFMQAHGSRLIDDLTVLDLTILVFVAATPFICIAEALRNLKR